MSCPICGMPPLDGEPCCTREYAKSVVRAADAKNKRLRAELESAKRQSTCVWSLDADEQYGHDSWDGTCGVKWCIPVGTPEENEMNFCPRCGAKLEQAKEKPDAT